MRQAVTATLALLLALSLSMPAAAGPDGGAFYREAKVANYAIPGIRYATPGYEHFSFWADASGRTRIRYTYGADARDATLRPLGANAQGTAFAAAFDNGLVLDIEPQGDTLRVRGRDGRYDKTFAWEYEGPVDGRGTFCTPCVGEDEAAAFVRRHFLAD